jgi:hypothetical protein
MSWTRQGGPSGPRSYHHGNLKETLIQAALALIAQKGLAGVTFAEAARWAGVSPAAPYRDCFAVWSRHCRPSAAGVRGRSAGGGYLRGLGLSLAPTGNRSGG